MQNYSVLGLAMLSMISQHRQIAVSPTQLDGQQIAPLLFRDGFDGPDTPGILVLLIPLLKLLQQLCFFCLIHHFTAFSVSSFAFFEVSAVR